MNAEAPPASAEGVFGERFALACRYAELLCTAGVERGLIGPREPARIWRRHLLNAAALAALVPADAEVVDVGSGAGLPGIPLLLARPDLQMTLVEPMLRRVTFCEEVREALDLAALRIVRARAEELPPRSANVVVVRAVAPLPRLLAMTLPLLRAGGALLLLKGTSAAQEVHDAADALQAADASVTMHLLGAGDEQTTVVEVRPGSDGIASAGVRAGQRREPRPR